MSLALEGKDQIHLAEEYIVKAAWLSPGDKSI